HHHHAPPKAFGTGALQIVERLDLSTARVGPWQFLYFWLNAPPQPAGPLPRKAVFLEPLLIQRPRLSEEAVEIADELPVVLWLHLLQEAVTPLDSVHKAAAGNVGGTDVNLTPTPPCEDISLGMKSH